MEVSDFKEQLESDDVARQRYGMFKVLEIVLAEEVDISEQPIKQLKQEQGYLYKLVQEFLNSSSTYEKRDKLGEIADFADIDLP
ncbi:MAG: hypothetical protein ABEJ03_03605 [Candidatus Nanohaloarchaea archaeon]